jgi:hypothetical protein
VLTGIGNDMRLGYEFSLEFECKFKEIKIWCTGVELHKSAINRS